MIPLSNKRMEFTLDIRKEIVFSPKGLLIWIGNLRRHIPTWQAIHITDTDLCYRVEYQRHRVHKKYKYKQRNPKLS